jgi:CRP-like cAMP-binding protein
VAKNSLFAPVDPWLDQYFRVASLLLITAGMMAEITKPVLPHVPSIESRLDPNRHILAQCPLFRGLSPEQIDEIAARMQARGGTAGTLLVAQDEPGEALFLVATGRVKVTVSGENGREVTLAILRAGDVFGEVALLDGSPRTANVVALTDSQVQVLSKEVFLEQVRKFPQLALNLMCEMARRLRRADETIAGLALQDVEGRLSRTLARLAREEGDVSVEGGLLLRRRPTQQELANMVGSSRETVSRTFTSLVRRGLLVPRGRTLVLTERMLNGMNGANA